MQAKVEEREKELEDRYSAKLNQFNTAEQTLLGKLSVAEHQAMSLHFGQLQS